VVVIIVKKMLFGGSEFKTIGRRREKERGRGGSLSS
jgi:hypothetical protein